MNQEERIKNKYCFDTSAFTDSWRRYYRAGSFETLWNKISEKIIDGSIVIPSEVKKEIGAGKDELINWLKPLHPHIIPISNEQIAIVSEIVNKYPLVSQYKKPRPYHADPFVVAVGKLTKSIVVTYEGSNKSNDHPKIPDLCKEYGVECCSISDFFEKEGWKFNFK